MTYDMYDTRYYMSRPDSGFKQTWTIVPSEPLVINTEAVTPEVGEVWYYKVRDASALGCGKICDLTPATVEIGGLQNWSHQVRYKRTDVEFVEKRT